MMIVDEAILKLGDAVYVKHSVYESVINYVSINGHLISIVNQNICMGPFRIKLEKKINLKTAEFPNRFTIQTLQKQCYQTPVRYWKKKDIKPIVVTSAMKQVIRTLQMRLKEEQKRLFEYSPFQQTLFTMFEEALQHESKRKWKSLIGAGPGLTPLGDDILVGVLLCHHGLGEVSEQNEIMSYAHAHTTLISSSFLEHAYHKAYSDDLYALYEMVFIDQQYRESCIRNILSFGSSSGFGILYGFTACFINHNKMEEV